jgi:hypothetical protein
MCLYVETPQYRWIPAESSLHWKMALSQRRPGESDMPCLPGFPYNIYKVFNLRRGVTVPFLRGLSSAISVAALL